MKKVDSPTANGIGGTLERASLRVTEWAGSSAAFGVAAMVIAVWAASGPLFRFSDTWQLVINTGTTIVTFLMVFLIQRSQNKEAQAVHLKLNELVAAIEGASNRLIDVEALSENEIRILKTHYATISKNAARVGSPRDSHSIEETTGNPLPHAHDPEE